MSFKFTIRTDKPICALFVPHRPAGIFSLMNRAHLLTEQRLAESMNLDAMPITQAVAVMHAQDLRAVAAVGKVQSDIAAAIVLCVESFRNNGRLFYFGAGTSGRLGILDASECPPTFRTDPRMVQGIIAGGREAMFQAREGAEDSPEGGAADVDHHHIGASDVVMGIAAGGTTPYVHGALRRARQLGAKTIFLSCVQPVDAEPTVDVVIRPLTGPEIVTGSTRLKAGTATKLVLNMITTLSMVQLNKVYENLMVDLKASNAKLWDRGARIISTLTQLSHVDAMELLKKADGHVKVAIVMHKRRLSADEARRLLDRHHGKMRAAIEDPVDAAGA